MSIDKRIYEWINQYRELTVSAVILGVVQGIVLNIAFVYAALTLGFSIGGSTVAAIIGYGLLRGVLKKGTIVENNINQTIASESIRPVLGLYLPLPVLFMLDSKCVLIPVRDHSEDGDWSNCWAVLYLGESQDLFWVLC